ncbi:glutathione S-transferase N-terminal domain-containing protein [Vibrio brasiliensis]|uniref:glutathione S-transferase N-terminal domain-containing protein n=1 Tax=Vibrio brasiliensis TaxID=170652 RepID=UPI001EFC6D40|nr:glutathione S-transferase N-terminal domain-containing protein [Vibrio brasiliensis]MCG9727419.1 glutathione S-transferase C-terminal domain-containing protein [Vibrio brasiliensis]
MITLYELAGGQGVNFSPYCWRTRMALHHKGLPFTTVDVAFTEIDEASQGLFHTLPFIHDEHNRRIGGSFEIAEYLENAYPDTPSLFSSQQGKTLALFFEKWARTLHTDIARIAIFDIFNKLKDQDKAYFRASREKALGDSLENVQSNCQSASTAQLTDKLQFLEQHLKDLPFVGGEAPLYADYIVYGTLKWLFTISENVKLTHLGPHIQAWYLQLDSKHSSNET